MKTVEAQPVCDKLSLVKQLGLKFVGDGCCIDGHDLERLLESAPLVKCGIERATQQDEAAGWLADQNGTHSVYTHTARLIGIQPLTDTKSEVERLKRALQSIVENPTQTSNGYSNLNNWVSWAKRHAAEALR